jgi:hypothetical protein
MRCGSSVLCPARAARARASEARADRGRPEPSHGRSRARQRIAPHACRAHAIAVSSRSGCAPAERSLHLGTRSASLCSFSCPLCSRVPTRSSPHTGLNARFGALSGLLGCVPMGHPHRASNLYQKRRPRHSTALRQAKLSCRWQSRALLGLLATNPRGRVRRDGRALPGGDP